MATIPISMIDKIFFIPKPQEMILAQTNKSCKNKWSIAKSFV
ncbi:hypothetical protein DESAMIL20_595 [Desulfurella amilsii]|uniref:Uncharacterized protein n=1 Tax=Desulfurella amilsii TaxID=1562698 RepID=A0A1X4XYT1_9BACT|nr:hypothetical protein DESAMIL20_595 [Desulfurella amilsii]